MSKITNYVLIGIFIITLVIGAYTYPKPTVKEVKVQEPTLEELKKIKEDEKEKAIRLQKEGKAKENIATTELILINQKTELESLKVQS